MNNRICPFINMTSLIYRYIFLSDQTAELADEGVHKK